MTVARHPCTPAPPAVEDADTLPGLFRSRVAASPDHIAYRQYDPAAGRWQSHSWRGVAERVDAWQAALAAEGLAKGARIAILLPNGLDWVCADQAVLALGLVVVPMSTHDTPANFAFYLMDSGASLILLEKPETWAAIAAAGQPLPDLARIVCTDSATAEQPADSRLCSLAAWLARGGDDSADTPVAPDDLATLVYTSGTTDRPKGVMLSHRNILSAVDSVLTLVPARTDDLFISYLPLSHVLELTMGYYVPMKAGSCIAFARGVHELTEDLQTIRPTIFMGVPRVYERVHEAIEAKAGGFLLRAAESLGWRDFEAGQGRALPLGPLLWPLWHLVRPLLRRALFSWFGGRVRIAVAGGAPMPVSVAHFFVALGFPLLEGYGLAEAAGPVCGNAPNDNLVGSVGRSLPGIEVRTSEQGELLVRAPSVMLGYWHHEAQTRETIDCEGWLHSGDIAEIIDGRVFIRDRLKEILVTSTGEKVPPANLEFVPARDFE